MQKNPNTFFTKIAQADAFCRTKRRPFIAVSYAQSVNGSIAPRNKEQMYLSGRQSLVLTHRLRSVCDAILVGIETVLIDDPQLTVRLVEGKNPQPIILDTRLRIPIEATLMRQIGRQVLIVSGQQPSSAKAAQLQQAGATILPCATNAEGRIDLRVLVNVLAQRGIRSLMVEGGAGVITSFINLQLVDYFIITITPKLLEGVQVIRPSPLMRLSCLQLGEVEYQQLDDDIVLWAQPVWDEE
ncbi:GTP cyclohydrolase [candidate division KSB3 bacterium]|uniref:GTP cyclohydrolase n=1 Tax=candidate division KSB3 bacterium TaxID=2044937 RepID=A0A9D5JTL8_9BACT|nr:GTP cyclohydrolase [candidate division KSB3 bacterium]MBD3323737.1 GTP cyclohydrolase [candidate division KSB3 bacterium]